MAYTDEPLWLSNSGFGEAITISSVSFPGQTIHESSSTAGVIDYLELFVSNSHTEDVQVRMRWAGFDEYLAWIPFQKGYFRLTPPRPITGGEVVRMNATVSGVIQVIAGAGSSRITIT